jgi:hypothetical protein
MCLMFEFCWRIMSVGVLQERDECIQFEVCGCREIAATLWALWCWGTVSFEPESSHSRVSSWLSYLFTSFSSSYLCNWVNFRQPIFGTEVDYDLCDDMSSPGDGSTSLRFIWVQIHVGISCGCRYNHVLKMSHVFNILDARGAVGVTERARFFGRMRM